MHRALIVCQNEWRLWSYRPSCFLKSDPAPGIVIFLLASHALTAGSSCDYRRASAACATIDGSNRLASNLAQAEEGRGPEGSLLFRRRQEKPPSGSLRCSMVLDH